MDNHLIKQHNKRKERSSNSDKSKEEVLDDKTRDALLALGPLKKATNPTSTVCRHIKMLNNMDHVFTKRGRI